MIDIEGVTHLYPDGLAPVLEDISLRIERGECVGLLGPSGSGKSTLASIVAGFIRPTKGKVSIDGTLTTGKPSRKVMLLSQESDLFPWQTVERHITFALGKRDVRRAEELIRLVHLHGHEKRYPNQLSGGMKKRLSLARALAVNPAVLILDEAFSSLDIDLKRVLYADLKEIWEKVGTTILLITHDIHDIERLAQRTYRLVGKPAHIAATP